MTYFHRAALPLHVLSGSAVGSVAMYMTVPLPRRAPTRSGTPLSWATTVPAWTLPEDTIHGPSPLIGVWTRSARDCRDGTDFTPVTSTGSSSLGRGCSVFCQPDPPPTTNSPPFSTQPSMAVFWSSDSPVSDRLLTMRQSSDVIACWRAGMSSG